MIHFSNFIKEFNSIIPIIEKLKVTGKSKVNNQSNNKRDLSGITIPAALKNDMYTKSASEEASHFNKMKAYHDKGSNPTRLLNSIKDRKKLVYRWYIAIAMGWFECEKVFKKGIIDRGYYTEDELDAYVLQRYKTYSKYIKQEYYIKYFEDYNIKYD